MAHTQDGAHRPIAPTRSLAASPFAFLRGSAAVMAADLARTPSGKRDVFDRAIARFAFDYADQTDRDHRAFTEAIAAGRLEITADPAG